MAEQTPGRFDPTAPQEPGFVPEPSRGLNIFTNIRVIASLSPDGFRSREHYDPIVKYLHSSTHRDTFASTNGKPNIDVEVMMQARTGSILTHNSVGIRDAVASVKVPGTHIPMFLHGGDYSLFDTNGELVDFIEQREGFVYADDTDKPHNAAPYTVSKPLALFALRALGRPMDISDQDNTEYISEALSLKENEVLHMGGVVVKIPRKGFVVPEEMIMGISSVEMTPEAIKHLLAGLRAMGAEHSIDQSGNNGHFTAAGFLDEVAGRIAEGYLNGKTEKELQIMVNQQWRRLMNAAIPGPLADQYH